MIAEIIREARATVFYEDDFGHADFMRCMEQGSESARVIALLSPEYQQSEYCRAEYNHVLGKDPANAAQRLIVLRVKPCEPTGGLQNLVYTDLVPVMGNYAALARVVRAAIGIGEPEILQPLQRAGQQIRHPEIRSFRGFAERDVLLGELDRLLWQGRGAVALRNSADATVALRGLGGVGKTVSAKEYAWRNRERYHGIWWIRAEKPETLIDDLVELGKRFIPGLDKMEPKQAAQTTIDQLAQAQTEKPWLLIYDNVSDPASIRLLIPASNAHVIVTTRWADWNGEADELPVDVFNRETAITFLVQDGGDREAAGRLADALDRLPLALSHARAYCRARGMPFDRYIANLPKLIAEAPRNVQYPASVFATFSLAIDQAKAACPEAETLMELLSFWAPDQIPLWLVPKDALSEDSLGDAIANLGAVSLVRPETLPNGDAALSVHRMVQAVTRARLQTASRFDKAASEATRSIEAAYDESRSFVAVNRNNYWQPHALTVVGYVSASPETSWSLFRTWIQIGSVRSQRGESTAAFQSYRAGFEIAAQSANAEADNAGWQRNLSISYDKLGEVLLYQGNLKEALKSFQDGLAIKDRLAKTNPNSIENQHSLCASYDRIGEAQAALGNSEDALKSFQDGLAIASRHAEAGHGAATWQQDIVLFHHKIGDLFVTMGKPVQALKSFGDFLEIASRLAEADPDNTVLQRQLGVAHGSVSYLFLEEHKFQDALSSLQNGIAIFARLAKVDPYNAMWQRDLAVAHERLGTIYARQDRTSEAISACEQALVIYRALIDRNPDDARSRLYVIAPLASLGKLRGREGRADLQQALDILKQLADADRLDAERRAWIPQFEAALAALDK
jgi:tetratricopeptide (TPR) repeat protein